MPTSRAVATACGLMLRNPIVAKGDQTFYRFFNTKFARPAEGTYGNATKDVIRGPGTNNWGISIAKKWPIGSESFGQFTVAYPRASGRRDCVSRSEQMPTGHKEPRGPPVLAGLSCYLETRATEGSRKRRSRKRI